MLKKIISKILKKFKIPKMVNSDKEMFNEMKEYVNAVCNENGKELFVPIENKELQDAIIKKIKE